MGGKGQELLGPRPSLPDPGRSQKPERLQVSLDPPAQELKAWGLPGTKFPGAEASSLGEVGQLATQPDPAVALGPSLSAESKGAWRSYSQAGRGPLRKGLRAELLC